MKITKLVNNNCHVCHAQAFCRPLFPAVLLRKLITICFAAKLSDVFLSGKLLTHVFHYLYYQLMVSGVGGNLGVGARDLVAVEYKLVLVRALIRAPPMEDKIVLV